MWAGPVECRIPSLNMRKTVETVLGQEKSFVVDMTCIHRYETRLDLHSVAGFT